MRERGWYVAVVSHMCIGEPYSLFSLPISPLPNCKQLILHMEGI